MPDLKPNIWSQISSLSPWLSNWLKKSLVEPSCDGTSPPSQLMWGEHTMSNELKVIRKQLEQARSGRALKAQQEVSNRDVFAVPGRQELKARAEEPRFKAPRRGAPSSLGVSPVAHLTYWRTQRGGEVPAEPAVKARAYVPYTRTDVVRSALIRAQKAERDALNTANLKELKAARAEISRLRKRLGELASH